MSQNWFRKSKSFAVDRVSFEPSTFPLSTILAISSRPEAFLKVSKTSTTWRQRSTLALTLMGRSIAMSSFASRLIKSTTRKLINEGKIPDFLSGSPIKKKRYVFIISKILFTSFFVNTIFNSLFSYFIILICFSLDFIIFINYIILFIINFTDFLTKLFISIF